MLTLLKVMVIWHLGLGYVLVHTKVRASHITQGNRYIKHALTLAGLTAGRSKDTAFSSLYNRISQRGSKMKAVIACAHKILRIIYKLLTTHQHYQKEKALGLR